VTLSLVRHGRPLIVEDRPPHEWELDPAGYEDIWALRTSGRLPAAAVWFSSPEPEALATAGLLTDGEVGVVDGLREHLRDTAEWIDDFDDAGRRAFAVPDAVAVPGWEPLSHCWARVVRAVDGILSAYASVDVVPVGHGTAWTVLAATLTRTELDLGRWRSIAMPDVITLDL
jgi:broad specificity phosphatase PhoE